MIKQANRLRRAVLPGLLTAMTLVTGNGCTSIKSDLVKTKEVFESYSPASYRESGVVIGKNLTSAVCGIPKAIDGVSQAVSLGAFEPFDHTGLYSDDPDSPNFKPQVRYCGSNLGDRVSYGLWSIPRGALNAGGAAWQIVGGSINSALQSLLLPTKKIPYVNETLTGITYTLSPNNRGLPDTFVYGLNQTDKCASMEVRDPNREYLARSLKDEKGSYSTGAIILNSLPAARHLDGDPSNKYVIKKDSGISRLCRAIGETIWWIPAFLSGGSGGNGGGNGSSAGNAPGSSGGSW